VDKFLSDFRLLAGTGAYSGATAADFNRVPVSIISGQMPEDL
jgi:hypothetical protein